MEIGYFGPKEGAADVVRQMAIPADAPHVAEAHEFINYMMRPEVIAKASNYVYYANGNKASQQFIDKAILDDPAIYPDEATLKKLFTVLPYDPKTQRIVTRTLDQDRHRPVIEAAKGPARPGPLAVSVRQTEAGMKSLGSIRRDFAPWSDPHGASLISSFDKVTKRFGDFTAVNELSLRHLRARVLRPARRLGLRQDHAFAHAGRLRGADRRPDPARRAGARRASRPTAGRST